MHEHFFRFLFLLGENIGRGAFGCVWLAEAVGLSKFQPRKVIEEKSKRNRLSILRNRKRYRYLYCPLKSKAAVKMLNGKILLAFMQSNMYKYC